MIDLSLLQSASYIAGALGVCVAAFYYALNLRETTKNRKIQMSNTILQTLMTTEKLRDWGELLNYSWTDTKDFQGKYDSSVNVESFAKRSSLWVTLETLGYLLKQGVVDRELVYAVGGSTAIFLWAKFKPMMDDYRKIAYGSDMYNNFEFLANEMWRMKKERDPSYTKDQTVGIDFEKSFKT